MTFFGFEGDEAVVFSGAVLISGEIGLEVDEVFFEIEFEDLEIFLEALVSSGFVIGGKQVGERGDAVKHG